MNFLAATESNGGMGIGFWVVYIVIIVAFMYFLMIRPQKKEQKRLQAWRNHRHHR